MIAAKLIAFTVAYCVEHRIAYALLFIAGFLAVVIWSKKEKSKWTNLERVLSYISHIVGLLLYFYYIPLCQFVSVTAYIVIFMLPFDMVDRIQQFVERRRATRAKNKQVPVEEDCNIYDAEVVDESDEANNDNHL